MEETIKMAIKKCFSVIGYHNSGKTSLLTRMIPLIIERGYSVSTIKHATHLDIDRIESLKDSEALFSAGSEKTVALGNDFAVIYSRSESIRSVLSQITSDVVIVEGFKDKPFPNILRAKDAFDAGRLLNELTIACVLDEPSDRELSGVPVFSPEEIDKITDLALGRSFPPLPMFDCGRCGEGNCRGMASAVLKGKRRFEECVALPSRVLLRVNGVSIPMKPFVEEVFASVISALVETLKDRPKDIRRIEIAIDI